MENSELTAVLIRLVLLGLAAWPFIFVIYKAVSFLRRSKRTQTEAVAQIERQQDATLLQQGHSPEYVDKHSQLRSLKKKRFEHKGTLVFAWISAAATLIFFPPLGIFITGFALIVTFREGSKARKELRTANQQISEVERSMPKS